MLPVSIGLEEVVPTHGRYWDDLSEDEKKDWEALNTAAPPRYALGYNSSRTYVLYKFVAKVDQERLQCQQYTFARGTTTVFADTLTVRCDVSSFKNSLDIETVTNSIDQVLAYAKTHRQDQDDLALLIHLSDTLIKLKYVLEQISSVEKGLLTVKEVVPWCYTTLSEMLKTTVHAHGLGPVPKVTELYHAAYSYLTKLKNIADTYKAEPLSNVDFDFAMGEMTRYLRKASEEQQKQWLTTLVGDIERITFTKYPEESGSIKIPLSRFIPPQGLDFRIKLANQISLHYAIRGNQIVFENPPQLPVKQFGFRLRY